MFYTGVIEDRTNDPLKLGRCRVRIMGFHSPDKLELPTEDLPWAALMQPVTSAATSGIGVSPTGFVEGTTVIVIFQDPEQQCPIIIGSVSGIQAAHKDQTIIIVQTSESLAQNTSDGSTPVPISPTSTTAPTPGIKINSGEIKKPTSVLVPSEACFEQIQKEESLSSLTEGKNNFVGYSRAININNDQIIYPYQDTKNIWTIGWGNTYLEDGSKVTASTRITKKQADDLLVNKVLNEFAPGVKSNLTAPVTQAMYDALVAIAYNTGVTGLVTSPVMAAVNSTNYEQAASLITILRTNNGELSARRLREKALFQSEGFPRKDMSGIEPPPDEAVHTPDDKTQNPVVTPRGPGQTGDEIEITRKVEGFRDPNGKYPKIVDEPDTNRLARHEKVDQTVVFSKESARAKDIKTGGFPERGEKKHKWTQPKIPYNSEYPYNHVYQSETGHIIEIDDTEGSERTHYYHRAGTYEEIDKNGTRMTRIIGDDYEVLERNGHLLVKGAMSITVMGKSNIRVEQDSNIDVLGDVHLTIGGKMEAGVTGDYTVKTDGKFIVDAKGMELKVTGEVNTEITGDVNTTITGDVNEEIIGNSYVSISKSAEIGAVENWRLHAGGLVAIDAASLAEQSGLALDVPLSLDLGVTVDAGDITMGKGPKPEEPQFPEITAPSRHDSDDGEYETPEDGDPSDYNKKMAAIGAITPNEILTAPEASYTPEEVEAVQPVIDCTMIPSTGPIDRGFQLSANFKLADLDKKNRLSIPPVVQITKAEVVCNLKAVAENVLEPIIKLFPSIIITSGYRNFIPVGGSQTSDHLYGAAVDIVIDGFDRTQHYAAIQEIAKVLPAYTQLILEYAGSKVWIHIGFNPKRGFKMQKFTMNNGFVVGTAGTFTLLG